MKSKFQLKSEVATLTTTADVVAYLTTEGISATIDPAADLATALAAANAAIDALNQFASFAGMFAAANTAFESPKARLARVTRELATVWNALGFGIAAEYDVEFAGAGRTTLRDGYTSWGCGTNVAMPTFVDGQPTVIPYYSDSVNSICACLTASGYGYLVQYIEQHPDALNVVMSGAKAHIVCQFVEHGNQYSNPFSTGSRAFVAKSGHRINQYITSLELSDAAAAFANEIARKVAGIA